MTLKMVHAMHSAYTDLESTTGLKERVLAYIID